VSRVKFGELISKTVLEKHLVMQNYRSLMLVPVYLVSKFGLKEYYFYAF